MFLWTFIASEVSLPPAAAIIGAEFIAESSLAPSEFELPNSGQGDRPDFKAGISEETTDEVANLVDDALVDVCCSHLEADLIQSAVSCNLRWKFNP